MGIGIASQVTVAGMWQSSSGTSGSAYPGSAGTGSDLPGTSYQKREAVGMKNGRSIASRQEIFSRLKKLQEERMKADDEKEGWRNPFVVTTEDMATVLYGERSKGKKESKVGKKPLNYSFREVTGKILRAKTSLSAGQAVLSARQKVRELKRKLASADSDADTEEITIALNHAKRIERVAKKKQRHLELEELIIKTQKHDEAEDKAKETSDSIDSAINDIKEEELADQQSELDRMKTDMFAEAIENIRSSGQEITDDMISALDEMIDSVFEEEQEMLDEMQEMMDSMEVIDPHMSPEQLEKLKQKHRNSEMKEIVKADADYWKSMMEHNADRISQISMPMASFTSVIDVASAPAAADLAMEGFDMMA